MEDSKKIVLKVWRFNPDTETTGHFQDYVVDTAEPLSVMALLTKVHELDSTFACRTSTCFKGLCASCLIRCNGRDVYGCTTLIGPGEAAVFEPHSRFRVIRDVVVDFSQPLSKPEEAAQA